MRLPTKKQIRIAGVAMVAIMTLFPPWKYTFRHNSTFSEESAGYSFIADPPSPRVVRRTDGVQLDLARLAVQLVALGALVILGNMVVPKEERDSC